ncbi:Glutathione peroxidase 3 [Sciurus carolinensis]|uniref:glutathione peroxidase n=1 Tax=Sciurus carolinensis TaxID=30640 RepID=A0AA41T5I4_SCICA|nr:Glutathione peroxidase 3 [Sciurus carolinensis]
MARLLQASCLLSLLLAGFVPPSRGQEKSKTDCHGGMSGTIYEYGALTIDGEEYIPFKQYSGKYILFVNNILPRYVRPGGGFVPNFQLFEKGDVNGNKEQKFYTFLKNSCPPTMELLGSSERLFWDPMKVHDIRWNFEKFLVGPDGIPIMRWHHRTTVSNVKMDILAYMRRQATLRAKG